MDLPELRLEGRPIRHADCCLSISSTLLDKLIGVFTEGSSAASSPCVLSVGSGSGLLEAVLLSRARSRAGPDSSLPSLVIHGVEVQQSSSQVPINKYLPNPFFHTVRSTQTVSPRLQGPDVVGLMFVYPRQPSLVTQYIDALRESSSTVIVVVWLGPVIDWDDYRSCFDGMQTNHGSLFETELLQGEQAGLNDYEMMAVMKRKLPPASQITESESWIQSI